MLSCCVLACAVYVRSDAIISTSERIRLLSHSEAQAFEKRRSNMKISTMDFTVELIVGGIFMAAISAVLIHQCFAYGINIISNLVGVIAVILISLILAAASFFIFLDVSHHPNDKAGLIEHQIHLFIHTVRVALEGNELALRSVLNSFHKKYECCGIYSISDYYTAQQINYPPDHAEYLDENSTVAKGFGAYNNSFRISNSWVHQCSAKATELLNSTAICYAPSYCCGGVGQYIVPFACPPVKWDEVGKAEPPRQLYRHPCAQRIATNYRNKMLVLTLIIGILILVAIINAIHLLVWRSRLKRSQKSPQSIKSTMDNNDPP